MKKQAPKFEFPDDEDVVIADEDGDTSSDQDPCENCGCPRVRHEPGKKCIGCGHCERFET